MSELIGRHALITGAGRGIGSAIATHLAEKGVTLTLVGRNLNILCERVAELALKTSVHALVCDVSDPNSVSATFESAREKFGPVSILVNNAGQVESAAFSKTTLEAWQRMLNVNLTGTFLCSQAALTDLLDSRCGRIINIASTAGLRGYPYVAAYVAAKHGVIGLTRAMALEFAKRGLTVNAICPGYTDTDIVRNSVARVVDVTGRDAEQALAEFVKSNPQGRLVSPHEVAHVVAWLCMDGASSVTGQSISVSGGEVM